VVRRFLRWPVSVLVLALVAGGCAGPGDAAGSPGTVNPGDRFYVSLGDSYAAGYSPTAGQGGATTTDGFAYQVADRARAAGVPLRLANFGCSGITSTQLRDDKGCAPAALGPQAPGYDGLSQADAAVRYLWQHHGQVALVTVVIGGNDVRPCLLTADGGISPGAMVCATAAVATLRTNLAAVLTQIRQAVGPGVPIVGLSYPDMFLGAWVSPNPDGQAVARGSVVVFRDVINSALKAEYAKAGAVFADITAATGAYGSLDATTTAPPYGVIPVPVAKVCQLTYYCRLGDVHPTVEGHRLIATQVLDAAHLS
jgi:lysophospholipase L1-like esterase